MLLAMATPSPSAAVVEINPISHCCLPGLLHLHYNGRGSCRWNRGSRRASLWSYYNRFSVGLVVYLCCFGGNIRLSLSLIRFSLGFVCASASASVGRLATCCRNGDIWLVFLVKVVDELAFWSYDTQCFRALRRSSFAIRSLRFISLRSLCDWRWGLLCSRRVRCGHWGQFRPYYGQFCPYCGLFCPYCVLLFQFYPFFRGSTIAWIVVWDWI